MNHYFSSGADALALVDIGKVLESANQRNSLGSRIERFSRYFYVVPIMAGQIYGDATVEIENRGTNT